MFSQGLLSYQELIRRLHKVQALVDKARERERSLTGQWHQPTDINAGRLQNVLDGREPDDWQF